MRPHQQQPPIHLQIPASSSSHQQQQQQQLNNNNTTTTTHHHPTMDRIASPSSPRVNTNKQAFSSSNLQQQQFVNSTTTTINNNNNNTISFENVQEETITIPLSQELIQLYQKQLYECLQKLKQTHTDGKDKAKSLEQIIYLACTLKSDFTLTLFGTTTQSSSSSTTTTQPPSSSSSQSTTNSTTNSNGSANSTTGGTTSGTSGTNSLLDLFIKCMRYLLLHRSSYIRSLTVRCMRYIIQNDPCNFPFELLWTKYNCHLLIFKMMLNDTDREKIQVLELIRTLCNNFVKRKQSKQQQQGTTSTTSTTSSGGSNVVDIQIPFLFMKGIVHFLSYIDGTLSQMEQQQPSAQQQLNNGRSTTTTNTTNTTTTTATGGNTGGNTQSNAANANNNNNNTNTSTATTNNLSSSANDQKKQYFLESYKSVCIEILRDSLTHDESLCSTVIKCGGFKYLVELLLNNKFSIYHHSILSSILYICDRYKTRKFMKKGLLQLLYLISPFTNYSQLHQPLTDAINNAKLTNPNLVQQLLNDLNQLVLELEKSKNIILFLMRSWTGLFIVNQDNTNILGTLSNLLKTPNRTQLKHLILDLYIEILKQSTPSKYHYLIPPIFNECEQQQQRTSTTKKQSSNNNTGTTNNNGTTTNNNTNVGGGGGAGAGGGQSSTAIGNSTNTLNTSTGNILSNATGGGTSSSSTGGGYGGFGNDATFYADHSADEDRVVNICFVFLSMTLLTLIDSGLIDSLLYLSKQSMINNNNKPRKKHTTDNNHYNVEKDKLNINDDDDEDKSERAFISFRASQLLQSVLLFSDMLLNKRTCLNMQDRFDTEIANFLLSISKSRNLYSYKTLSMLSAFYQQSFQTTTTTGSNNSSNSSIRANQSMIQGPNSNLSVLSTQDGNTSGGSNSSSSDAGGSGNDKFSKFSTNNIPTFYIRTQIDSDMDDQSFNQLIKESNVLVTKDPKRWNWEKIYCLIFGPLRVAHRLKEVTTKSQQKLLKRILSYFKPYKRAFSELKYQESNFGYTKLCSELLYNLLHMDESGIEIIRECKIIKQFYEVLELEVRVNKSHHHSTTSNRNDSKYNDQLKLIDSDKRLLSEERVQKYMVRDYFTIIGLMSSTIKGKELLEEEKIFDVLKDLTTRRDDICQLIIKHLDYTRPFSDRAREILKEAMMNGSNIIRYISTLFIRHLIRQSQTYPNNFHAWGVPLLTSKLYDDWEKVKFSAISILSEVCCMNVVQPSSSSSMGGGGSSSSLLHHDHMMLSSSSSNDFDYDHHQHGNNIDCSSSLSSHQHHSILNSNSQSSSSSSSNENLLAFVSQSISRDQMESVMREGRDGMNLLLKMTSCREGIDYLSHDNIRLLQELVEDWFERESYQYLQQVEYGLNRFYHSMNNPYSNYNSSGNSTGNGIGFMGGQGQGQQGIGNPALMVVGSLSPNGFNRGAADSMTSPSMGGSGNNGGFRSPSSGGNNTQFQSLSGSYDYAKHGVILQSNLYGELCHTLEGCTILTNDKNRTLHCLCLNLLNVYESVLNYHRSITTSNNKKKNQTNQTTTRTSSFNSDNESSQQQQIQQIVELWSLAFCCSTNTGYEYCNRYIQQVIIGYEKHQNEHSSSTSSNGNTGSGGGSVNNVDDASEDNEQYSVVQYFVYIALHSKDISLRGTMLYLLGILSKCSLARKDLFEAGFECSYRYAISIPRDRKSFFTIINDHSNNNTNTNGNNTNSHESSTTTSLKQKDEEDHLLTSILKESPKNADLIKDLVSNVTKIANPVHEQQSSTNLQNLKPNIARVLTNNEKSKLIYYFLGNHFTHCKYKWKIIKFVINELLGGNSSMLCSSIATSNLVEGSSSTSNSPFPIISGSGSSSVFDSSNDNTVDQDELYVMNSHLLWLDTETAQKFNNKL